MTNSLIYVYSVPMLTREQMQNNLIQRLFWHTSERDESKVADYLFCRKEMDTVYTLDEVPPRRDSISFFIICVRLKFSLF